MFGRKRKKQQAEGSFWDPAVETIPGTTPVVMPHQPSYGLTMPIPPRPGVWVEQLDFEQVELLAGRAMWARETILWMLHRTAEHRWDGHECPVYCIPDSLDQFLAHCTEADLRLLMATVIKDSVHMGSDPDFEDLDEGEAHST